MGNDANYTLAGLFVIIFTAGVLAFAYWLAKSGTQGDYTMYQIYMSESVAGLSTDSAVKYQGVDIGTVAKLELDSRNPERVHLLLKIQHDTPVRTDTTATLMFYGITGLAFIELQGGSKGQRLKASGNKIPTIPTRPSTITRLDTALSKLATKSTRALDKIDQLLNDENLGNITTLMRTAPGMLQSFNKLAVDMDAQLGDLHRLIRKGVTMEGDVSQTLKDISRASNSASRLATALQHTYGALGEETREAVGQVSDKTRKLFDDIETLITQVQATVDELRTRPADIFFSRSRIRPGPGEEAQQ